MAQRHMPNKRPRGRGGFRSAGSFLGDRIKTAGQKRGFAVARLLTHWAEVVGPDFATCTRPVDIRYGREGFGATLTVLTTGAQAPLLRMQEPKLRERVNAVYGYNAIARIRLTQTSATGFAEGQAQFEAAPETSRKEPSEVAPQAKALTTDIESTELQRALNRLGTHILAKPVSSRRPT